MDSINFVKKDEVEKEGGVLSEDKTKFISQFDQEQSAGEKPFPKKSRRIFKWLAIIIVIFLLLGTGVWGFYFYEKNFLNVSIEEVLPSDSDLVMQVTIDPNSEQFSFLEKI